MPSTFTDNGGIEKIGLGEQAGTWGTTTNTNLDIIDRLINGVGTITLSGTTHTLTTSDGSLSDGMFKVLVLAGSPSGTNTITISPNNADKLYFVKNGTSQTATFTQGSGGNVSIAAGKGAIIFADGAGSTAAVTDLTALFTTSQAIDGINIGANTPGTGAFTALTVDNVVVNGANIGHTDDTDLITLANGSATVAGQLTATGDLATSGTVIPSGDTASGDNAAIGFTSSEGIIITGQGSTNDVTIKNDADTTVIAIPTGGTGVSFAGTITTPSIVLGSTTITSTASELNLVDGSSAGTIVNSKAVIYGSSGEVNATTLQIAGTSVTSTAAELNILDGVTATASELNIMDGVTATTAEINILDGVTATASEINILDGVTATASEINLLDGVSGLVQADFTKLAAVTSSAAELNVLDGYTGSVTELNYLDTLHATGVTSSEFDFLDGVTSNIQTQLDAKAASITGAATTIDTEDLTASRALVSNSSGKVAVSAVTSTEIGYLDGVSSNIQTQLNTKVTSSGVTSVATGSGLSGGTITSTGTVSLSSISSLTNVGAYILGVSSTSVGYDAGATISGSSLYYAGFEFPYSFTSSGNVTNDGARIMASPSVVGSGTWRYHGRTSFNHASNHYGLGIWQRIS